MKKILVTLCTAVVLFNQFGCTQRSKNDHKPYYQFYNFSPNSPPLVALVDNWSAYPSGVEYRKAGGYSSPYVYDNTGVQTLKIYSKVTNTKLLEAPINMQNDFTYSIFALGFPLSMEHVIVPSYAKNTAKCNLRFVNLCPDCGDSVKLTIAGVNYTGIVPFKGASDYIEVEPGTYVTEARTASGEFIASERQLQFPFYQTVDVVLSGYKVSADTLYSGKLTIVQEME